MAFFELRNARISAVAAAVPDDLEYTADYAEQFGEDYVKKFAFSTGVESRYTAQHLGVTSADLCFAASEKILTELNYDRSRIDVLIFASYCRDYLIPATAYLLQDRLKLSDECICYDVPLGCPAYVYGLYLSAMHINSGARSVLLLTASTEDQVPASYVHRNLPMLIGHAGTATLIEYDEAVRPMRGLLRSMGRGMPTLVTPYGGQRHPFLMVAEDLGLEKAAELNNKLYMEGMDVMRFSLTDVVQMVEDFKAHFNCDWDDYEILACHQANKLIVRNFVRKINFPMDKVPLTIDRYSNTGGASIPVTICDYYSRQEKPTERAEILTCGFGVGLSLGIVGITVNPRKCFPIFKIRDRFDDHLTYEKFH